MSKQPDLSAFPIPRKGAARPIAMEDTPTRRDPSDSPFERAASGATGQPSAAPKPNAPDQRDANVEPALGAAARNPEPKEVAGIRRAPAEVQGATGSGQVVATTVKLDENRYLRLSEAGRPGPGRLKRRTIQEIMIEALDEWFDRRGL